MQDLPVGVGQGEYRRLIVMDEIEGDVIDGEQLRVSVADELLGLSDTGDVEMRHDRTAAALIERHHAQVERTLPLTYMQRVVHEQILLIAEQNPFNPTGDIESRLREFADYLVKRRHIIRANVDQRDCGIRLRGGLPPGIVARHHSSGLIENHRGGRHDVQRSRSDPSDAVVVAPTFSTANGSQKNVSNVRQVQFTLIEIFIGAVVQGGLHE